MSGPMASRKTSPKASSAPAIANRRSIRRSSLPAKIYKFAIDLWSTSNVFKKGHTLRLEISSSNFPRFDRNLNTGNQRPYLSRHANSADAFTTATNTILHDADHPSALTVSIVPAK